VSRLGELHSKVDGFFARVAARHGEDMQCSHGCSDCCHVRLTITEVEAAAIRGLVERWPTAQRQALAETGPADRCAALDADGRCKIYDARPIVCRSHGAPIRMRKDSLPVIESCFRNFTQSSPDPDCVLDQETLSALTLAVDRDAGGTGARVELAGLVSELARV
jgi:Fe-S-cluster containining protein